MQRRCSLIGLALLAGCQDTSLQPSIWPPEDFELVVEEMRFDAGNLRTVRRLDVHADGLVVYGVSPRAREDASSGTTLPVFETLSVYELVPTCVRALARRIDRLGVDELDTVQGERGGGFATSLQLSWRAFGQERRIRASGRVSGAFAEILAVVAAHLPDGESFGLPGLAERPVVHSLRGVPLPRTDAAAALAVHRDLLQRCPGDEALLLHAFALACDRGDRALAAELLASWAETTAVARRQQSMFPEGDRLTPEILAAMLPAD